MDYMGPTFKSLSALHVGIISCNATETVQNWDSDIFIFKTQAEVISL